MKTIKVKKISSKHLAILRKAGYLVVVAAFTGCAGVPQEPVPTPANLATYQPSVENVMIPILRHTWHGIIDASLDVHQMLRKVEMGGTLSIQCGVISVLAVYVLQQAGYEARMVNTVTLDAWNGLDDGHNMVEAKVGGQWVLYDFDNHGQVLVNGQPTTLDGAIHNIDSVSLKVLEESPSVDPQFLVFYPTLAPIFQDVVGWYHRVMQVQMFTWTDGKTYFSDDRQTEVQGHYLDATYLPHDVFVDLAYGN